MFLSSNLSKIEEYFNAPIDKKRHVLISGNKNAGKKSLCNSLICSNCVLLTESGSLAEILDRSARDKPLIPYVHSIRPFIYLNFKSSIYSGENYFLSMNDRFECEDLHLYDGLLFVVDCNEPIKPETEKLFQLFCIDEQMKPILIINKIDSLLINEDFTHVNDDYESIYLKLEEIINNINDLLAKNNIDFRFSPNDGTVVFSSSLFDFSFTIQRFAHIYNEKVGAPLNKLGKMLWGNYFYNSNAKHFVFKEKSELIQPSEEEEQRTFCKFILNPLIRIAKAVIEHDTNEFMKIIHSLHLNISQESLNEADPKMIYIIIMKKWLLLGNSLLETVIHNIPSPKDAQIIRYKSLISTKDNELFTNCMKNCDPNAPPIIYISHIFPPNKERDINGRFYAVGRIFSGTIHPHQSFKLISPSFEITDAIDCSYRFLMYRNVLEEFFTNPLQCGNIIYISFPKDILMPNGLLVSPELINSISFYPIKLINSLTNKYNTFITITVENQQDYPHLKSAIHFLSRMSSKYCISFNEDELKVKITCYEGFNFDDLIHDLREIFLPNGVNLNISEPQKM